MRNNEVRRAGVGEQWRVELSTNLRGVSHCTEKALLGPSPCWKCLQVWWNGFIRSFIIKDRKKFLVTAQLREGLLTLTGVVARCDLIKLSHNGPHSSHSSPQLTVAHPSSPHCLTPGLLEFYTTNNATLRCSSQQPSAAKTRAVNVLLFQWTWSLSVDGVMTLGARGEGGINRIFMLCNYACRIADALYVVLDR